MQYKKVIGLWAISASFVSCALLKPFSAQHETNIHVETDSISVIYNDSIDSIILDADKVRIYDMANYVMNQDSVVKRDSLLGYGIERDFGLLKKKEKAVLSFIVSDKKWYIKNYAPIRQPFHPNIALEFTFKKEKAFMFISFGNEEVAISDIMGNFKFYQMHDIRSMARFISWIFPKEEYYKKLIK